MIPYPHLIYTPGFIIAWHWWHILMDSLRYFKTLRLRQNIRHFAEDIFKLIFLNENVWISTKIPLKFVLKVPIDNIPALVQITAWWRPHDRPLSEPMMVSWLTHKCITWPQWVNPVSGSLHCAYFSASVSHTIYINFPCVYFQHRLLQNKLLLNWIIQKAFLTINRADCQPQIRVRLLNTYQATQTPRHLAEHIFKPFFYVKNYQLLIQISLKFVPGVPSKQAIIGSDNGLEPNRQQAII